MPRRVASGHFIVALLASGLATACAAPAQAVVNGTSSSLGHFTVRLAGAHYCSGVAVGRRIVVTAAHCARGIRVYGGGGSVGIAGVTRSAVLDDGRRITVSGDAAILKLSAPLPAGIGFASVGEGAGESYVIAGYGTPDERHRLSFGTLREARLVAASPRALVDPNRTGSIGASACFGDSGGPVLRGGELVGIITRAAHPSPRIACGHLTRWAPVSVSGQAQAVAAAEEPPATERRQRRRHARAAKSGESVSANLFANWFAPKAESRKLKRRKQAAR
ncbi:MAG: trypsin-like serine protease [Pseudolabrys sp.]